MFHSFIPLIFQQIIECLQTVKVKCKVYWIAIALWSRMKQRVVWDVCRDGVHWGDELSLGLCGEDKAVGGMGHVQGWGALGGLGLCGVWVHVEMEQSWGN